MTEKYRIGNNELFYDEQPDNPQEGTLWADSDDNYVKVRIYVGGQWHLVTDMSNMDDGEDSDIVVEYGETPTEDMDIMDYNHRIGYTNL